MVTVLPKGRSIYIYNRDNIPIATHRLGFKTRSMVYLPDQHKGLTSESAQIATRGRGNQIEETQVEIRSLDDYMELVANA